ncbi:Alpha/Beta hydrolase protein, partial [Dendryphion nanum]
NRPTFLLLHGWPSSSYDWRHQIKSLSAAGYGVLVPDLLGYGDTDKQIDVYEYTFKKMVFHLVKMFENEGLTSVIGVGHDWYGTLPKPLHEKSLNQHRKGDLGSWGALPITTQNTYSINELTTQMYGYPTLGFWYFCNEDDVGKIADDHADSLTALLYAEDPDIVKTDLCPVGKMKEWITSDKLTPIANWLTEEEIKTHDAILKAGGYNAPFKWLVVVKYRMNADDDAVIPFEQQVLSFPVMFIGGEKDYVTHSETVLYSLEMGQKYGVLPNAEAKIISGSTHWVPLDSPQELHDALVHMAKRVAKTA